MSASFEDPSTHSVSRIDKESATTHYPIPSSSKKCTWLMRLLRMEFYRPQKETMSQFRSDCHLIQICQMLCSSSILVRV